MFHALEDEELVKLTITGFTGAGLANETLQFEDENPPFKSFEDVANGIRTKLNLTAGDKVSFWIRAGMHPVGNAEWNSFVTDQRSAEIAVVLRTIFIINYDTNDFLQMFLGGGDEE